MWIITMKYSKLTLPILVLLCQVPAFAAPGSFTILRSTAANNVNDSAAVGQATAGRFDDSSGSLRDGQSYFYVVRDWRGESVDLTVDKDRAGDRVLVFFDATAPADPSLSSVSVSPATVPADGASVATVSIIPRDSSGQELGPGLALTLDPSMLAPGVQFGSIQDMGDGSYVVQVVSSQIGQAVVEIEVDGVLLDDQPTLVFHTVFQETFQVNASTVGDQSQPGVGQATDGGSVMVWRGADADGDGVLARVFNADGSPAGDEFLVNTTTTGNQQSPAVAVGADRRFAVVWESADADGLGVWAQLYDALGQPVGTEVRVNVAETGDQHHPSVMMSDDGSYVVVWQGPDANADGIHARMNDALGQPLGDEFLVNTDEAGAQQNPQAAMAGNGFFVVLWQSTSGIYAQLYNPAGTPIGTQLDVHLGLTGLEGIPQVAIANSGAFIAVWQGGDGAGVGIVAHSFDPVGLPLTPSEVVVNTSTYGRQDTPDVAMADNGLSLIVWQDHSRKEIRGQRFAASGAAVGEEFLVSAPLASQPDAPATALAGDGTSYIVLYEADDGNGRGVFASWVPLLP